jgi:hypothetical protein
MASTSHSASRASAGRIVDILQQLVLARPEMIVPLEQIARGILGDPGDCVETQMWQREEAMHLRGRTPLPPMPLSELPALLALLQAPSAGKTSRLGAASRARTRKSGPPARRR